MSREDIKSLDDTRPTEASPTSKPEKLLATNNTAGESIGLEYYTERADIAKSESTAASKDGKSDKK